MSFKSIFLALGLGGCLILAALIINNYRPSQETSFPHPDFVRASGKCAECHRNETSAIVHQFERSPHAQSGLNCLSCHQVLDGQNILNHKGFKISREVTSKNCQTCHATEYKEFERSRHGAPAWAAVRGDIDFTQEQIDLSEKYHPGAVKRPVNKLAQLEGDAASIVGCQSCHEIGKPNSDGSIGSCTHCHSRHNNAVALARQPESCGQCHMGPDHSQMEIFNESKHGFLWQAQKNQMNLNADPKTLSTADMPVPSCATCHMSGLEGAKVTHDVTERLSFWLFAPVSQKRPNYNLGQAEMKGICLKCHASSHVEKFYKEAESVVYSTNRKILKAKKLMDDLRNEKLLSPEPFDEAIEFLYFDLWHYFGRTAKHGAFMGGADFVQWHGNYELLLKMTELEEMAVDLREKKRRGK